MTDIMTSDVMRFIEWVTAMPIEVYHLARPLLHGVCRLYEIERAKLVLSINPTHAARYDFIGCLAGGNPEELDALKDEATSELVADFYAAHSRWVSVEDRLPDQSDYYLIYYGVVEAYGSTWWSDSAYPFTDDVTHWMPLPDPPEATG